MGPPETDYLTSHAPGSPGASAFPTLPDDCTCARGPLCRLAALEYDGPPYGPSDNEGAGCQHSGDGSCLHIVHEICPACMVAGYEDADEFCAGCGDIVRAGQAEHDGGTFTDFDGTLASWGDAAPYHPLCLALRREMDRQQALARYGSL